LEERAAREAQLAAEAAAAIGKPMAGPPAPEAAVAANSGSAVGFAPVPVSPAAAAAANIYDSPAAPPPAKAKKLSMRERAAQAKAAAQSKAMAAKAEMERRKQEIIDDRAKAADAKALQQKAQLDAAAAAQAAQEQEALVNEQEAAKVQELLAAAELAKRDGGFSALLSAAAPAPVAPVEVAKVEVAAVGVIDWANDDDDMAALTEEEPARYRKISVGAEDNLFACLGAEVAAPEASAAPAVEAQVEAAAEVAVDAAAGGGGLLAWADDEEEPVAPPAPTAAAEPRTTMFRLCSPLAEDGVGGVEAQYAAADLEALGALIGGKVLVYDSDFNEFVEAEKMPAEGSVIKVGV